MNTLFWLLILTVPTAALGYLAFHTYKKRIQGRAPGKAMKVNLAVFLVLLVLISALTLTVTAADDPANNEQTQAADEQVPADNSKGLGLLAAGIVTGLAGIGGGIAVAAGAPAAIAATSEDPKVFGKALIFVALGETIALYGVVISILILNKI